MQYPGDLDLQSLAELNNIEVAEGEVPPLSGRALDSDGDGRPDLYLVDLDLDGEAEAVVKALDTDGDGSNDTFIQYKEDGSIQSIGRVDQATGELQVVYEEPSVFEEILDSLGLIDLPSPEEALFGSFENPYVLETYGSYGEEVPDFFSMEPESVEDFSLTEVSLDQAEAMGAAELDLEQPAAAETEAESSTTEPVTAEPTAAEPGTETAETAEAPTEVIPKITEIEDRSGGAGSSLWAKVDADADGIADYDSRIEKTSTGTYYGDINKDGYSENVATDLDMDGRIDTVDTTGQGSSADVVDASQVVEPGSSYLADQPGESDAGVSADAGDIADAGSDTGADEGIGTGSDYDAGSYDSGADGIASGSDYDAGSYDSGSSDSGGYDSGSSGGSSGDAET